MKMKPGNYFSSYSIVTVFALLTVVGIFLGRRVPVQLNPSNRLPTISIIYSYPNAEASGVERKVTSVFEGVLSVISDIKNIRSHSHRNGGNIQLEFDAGVDLQMKRYEVSAALRNSYASLPDEVSFPTIQVGPAEVDQDDGPFLVYALTSIQGKEWLQETAEREITDVLNGLSGVDRVELSGVQEEEIELVFHPEVLGSLGLSKADLVSRLQSGRTRSQLGHVYPGQTFSGDRYSLVLEHEMQHPRELLDIPIHKQGNRVITLGDVATIRIQEPDPVRIYRVNGRENILLEVYAAPDANLLSLGREVKRKLDRIEQKLQGSINLVVQRDATKFLTSEIEHILLRCAFALGLLILFMLLVYRNARFVLLMMLCLVVNVSMAFMCYYFLGIHLHFFSFAGITITFGMILDNVILVQDHIRKKGKTTVLVAVVASTLTTLAAVSIIFLADREAHTGLRDFAWVVTVNLAVSLVVSLVLVPALYQQLHSKSTSARKTKYLSKRSARRLLVIQRWNEKVMVTCRNYRVVLMVLAVLAFGLPVFKLPQRMDEKSKFAGWYNDTFASFHYQRKVRPIIDQWLGGSLRLFVEHVEGHSVDQQREETVLNVAAQLPEGSTLEHSNMLFASLESFLWQFPELENFELSVPDPSFARMSIYFREGLEHTNFPILLKNKLTTMAIGLGSAEWQISGAGDGFNNSTLEQSGRYFIYLYGFSYPKLKAYADEIKAKLEANRRITNLYVSGQRQAFRNHAEHHVMNVDREELAKSNMSLPLAFQSFETQSTQRQRLGPWVIGQQDYELVLSADKEKFDFWSLRNMVVGSRGNMQKLTSKGTLKRVEEGDGIYKLNQRYQLVIDFDYVGTAGEGYKFMVEEVENLEEQLPIGFEISTDGQYYSGTDDGVHYGYVLIVIVAIYFICAILLESLTQPLLILLMVPISFIGLFLSFSLLEIPFGQGGYASMLLLSGLTVNAALYILYEYNQIKRIRTTGKRLSGYVKAFGRKITPVMLTILSTLIGMIPFLMVQGEGGFWLSLATGTISGLLCSLIAIYCYLPVFLSKIKPENT